LARIQERPQLDGRCGNDLDLDVGIYGSEALKERRKEGDQIILRGAEDYRTVQSLGRERQNCLVMDSENSLGIGEKALSTSGEADPAAVSMK